jgi:hypothetical protein
MANGYKLFSRTETKIMLNNDSDGLNLYSPDKKLVDSVSYNNALINQSYNRTSSGWGWSTSLTPGAVNVIAVPAKANKATKTAQTIKVLPKTEKSVNNDIIQAGTADLSKAVNTNQINPWFLFFIVLTVIIILAIAVLLIKIRLNKKEDPCQDIRMQKQ